MSTTESRKNLTAYIEKNKKYLSYNTQLFDIYEGNLRPYVDAILKSSLSENYYNHIRERIYPINILKRIIDKMSRSYSMNPIRTTDSHKEILEFYETSFMINQRMNMADEYVNMFKGYALEPYLKNGIPSLRVLPFDRFLAESDSMIDRTIMTRFYKYIGKVSKQGLAGRTKEVDAWFIYTDQEFIVIDEDGDIIKEFMQDDKGNQLNGENPLGFIPIYYGNRSEYKILPTQDTDTLALSKLLPVQISDLGGMILFQCFSVMYGIDIDAENVIMSPNAFWSLKSDPQSDKTPQLGTIKPSADVNKVLDFIRETFATWLESRGIRVGSIGKTDGTMNVSGISKIIDEMDTFDAIKKQIEYFKVDEYNFWQLIKKTHNYWVSTGELKMPMLPENWEVFTEFDAPRPAVSRTEEIDDVLKEHKGGIISKKTAISKLYPDWTEEDVKKEIEEIKQEGEKWQNGKEFQ